jgi:cytochrome c553
VVELPLPAWVLYGFDVIPDAAQRINHTLAPAQPVAAGVTAAHGAYVANMCIGCHGAGTCRAARFRVARRTGRPLPT